MELTTKELTTGEGLKKVADAVAPEIRALRDAVSPLWERWEQVERLGRNQKDTNTVQLYENYENRPTPILSSRRKRVVANVAMSILGADPWVQFTPDDGDQTGGDRLERGLQVEFERAGFSRMFRRALGSAFDCGVTFIKARTVGGEGLVLEHVHSKNMVRGPLHGLDTAKSYLMGNKFWLCEYDVQQRIDSGKYAAAKLQNLSASNLGTGDPDDDPAGRDKNFDLASGQAYSDARLRGIDLYDVVVSLPMAVSKDKVEFKRYRVVLSERSETVLAIEPYVYSRPWYFDVRYHDEEEFYFPSTSKGHGITPMCLSQTEQFNLMVAGNMGSCAPPFLVTGGVLGEKGSRLGLGEYWETNQPIEFQQFPVSFDAGDMPMLIEKVDQMLDAETGFSRAGMSQEFKSGTSATAAAGAMAAQAQVENADALQVAESIEPLWAFVREMNVMHPKTYSDAYGEALGADYWANVDNAGRFQMTGRNPGNTPAVMMQKLSVLDEFAQRPDSQWSRDRIEEAIVNGMQFSFRTEGLKLTDEERNTRDVEERDRAALAAQAAAQAGGSAAPDFSGGVPGVVPQAGGPVPPGMVPGPAEQGAY